MQTVCPFLSQFYKFNSTLQNKSSTMFKVALILLITCALAHSEEEFQSPQNTSAIIVENVSFIDLGSYSKDLTKITYKLLHYLNLYQ